MAKAFGYIIIYNNNGDIVYQHKGSGGDYGGTVSISNNVITISSDYAPQVEPIDDSDPEFPDRWSTVIDTGEVNVSNLTNPTSLQIVLPYKASKIRYFGGQFGEFADAAGSDYADAIINNGETITLASNNYASGGGCAIQYYEEATSKVSVDLINLPGWASLSAGSHNITIVAKADGYADSEPSAAVSVEKAAAGYTVTITEANAAGNYTVYINGVSVARDLSTNIQVFHNVKTFNIECVFTGNRIYNATGSLTNASWNSGFAYSEDISITEDSSASLETDQ